MYANFAKSLWLYRLLALVFAVMLFFIANSRSLTQPIMSTRNYQNTLESVNIDFTYNDDEYYISGYQTTAKVHLKSTNKVLLDTEANEQTRSFKIVANLSDFQEGTVEVPLKVENLKTGVTATVEPKTIPVTIEKKVTETFKVEPSFDTNMLAEGYELKGMAVEPEEVKITTGDKTLKSIAQVVAFVSARNAVTENFEDTALIQAFDKDGSSLAVSADPVQVKVQVSVSAPRKTVNLHVNQTGKMPTGVEYYSFALSQDTVEISGSQTSLDGITQIEIPVNISGIKEPLTQSYKLSLPQGVKAAIEYVKVTITPTWTKTETTSSSVPPESKEDSSSLESTSSTESSLSTQESSEKETSSN